MWHAITWWGLHLDGYEAVSLIRIAPKPDTQTLYTSHYNKALQRRRGGGLACLVDPAGDGIEAVTRWRDDRPANHRVSNTERRVVGDAATAEADGAAPLQPRRHGEGGGGLCVLT